MDQLLHELPVLRARLGASQADIANKIGISRQTYNSIETRKRDMSWTTCVALIAVFQNNEETKAMLNNLVGFEEELMKVMNIDDEELTR